MVALLLMIAGAATIVAGLAWAWLPLGVIAGGGFLLAAGLDLANRPPRRREASR